MDGGVTDSTAEPIELNKIAEIDVLNAASGWDRFENESSATRRDDDHFLNESGELLAANGKSNHPKDP